MGNNKDSDQPSQSLCYSCCHSVCVVCSVSAFQEPPVENKKVSVAPSPPAHTEKCDSWV